MKLRLKVRMQICLCRMQTNKDVEEEITEGSG